MNTLVAIPPLARTILYYVLALANAVLVPLTAAGEVDPTLGLIVVGVSGVFGFTLAASNVTRTVSNPVAPWPVWTVQTSANATTSDLRTDSERHADEQAAGNDRTQFPYDA